VLAAVCGTAPPPTPAAGGRVTALMGGRVLPSPQAAVISEGVATPDHSGRRVRINYPDAALLGANRSSQDSLRRRRNRRHTSLRP